MEILIYILIGLSGGILGGLGMGGGTLLIPLLALFTSVSQHTAQTVNLIAFIPMSAFALIIHMKNKLVKFRYLLTISLPATIVSVGAAFVAKGISAENLGRWFGVFLTVLGVCQITALIVKTVREHIKKKKRAEAKKV